MKNKKEKREILSKILGKVKMHSAGEEQNYPEVCCDSPSKNKEKSIYYPNLYLNTKQAPSLTTKDVEDEVTMLIKGVISSHSLNENGKRKNESFDVKIKEIGLVE